MPNTWLDPYPQRLRMLLAEAGYPDAHVYVENGVCAPFAMSKARSATSSGTPSMKMPNAVGAIIDSGGYCEGPHDVAAAIYRLTRERDGLRALIDDFVDPGDCRFDHHGHCQEHAWFETDPACPHKRAKALPAVGGAPGVSETHTDPKEASQ